MDRFGNNVGKLHHAVETLRAYAAAFRAVVHFDLHPIDPCLLLCTEPTPPRRQRVDDEVAGLEGTTESHVELPRVFVHDPTGDVFLLAAQIMITGFVIAAGLTAA
jgi:hypothetical protein